MEQFADIVAVVLHAGYLPDQRGDTGKRPQGSGKAVGFGALQKGLHDLLDLLVREARASAGRFESQSLAAFLQPDLLPSADGRSVNADAAGDFGVGDVFDKERDRLPAFLFDLLACQD